MDFLVQKCTFPKRPFQKPRNFQRSPRSPIQFSNANFSELKKVGFEDPSRKGPGARFERRPVRIRKRRTKFGNFFRARPHFRPKRAKCEKVRFWLLKSTPPGGPRGGPEGAPKCENGRHQRASSRRRFATTLSEPKRACKKHKGGCDSRGR